MRGAAPPRLRGTLALEAALAGRPLDFCLLLLLAVGRARRVRLSAYSAANAFLDAFAARTPKRERPLAQRGLGPLVHLARGPAVVRARRARVLHDPAGSERRPAARAVRGRVAQVVVSSGDLDARLDRIRSGSRSGGMDDRQPRPPRPCTRGRSSPQTYVAPRKPVESSLATIWGEVLGLETVGVDDDFFELGGDSVLGLQVVSKANDAGYRLRASQIFEHHTIAALASVASSSAPAEATQAEVAAAGAFPAARLNQKDVDKVLARLGARGPLPK